MTVSVGGWHVRCENMESPFSILLGIEKSVGWLLFPWFDTGAKQQTKVRYSLVDQYRYLPSGWSKIRQFIVTNCHKLRTSSISLIKRYVSYQRLCMHLVIIKIFLVVNNVKWSKWLWLLHNVKILFQYFRPYLRHHEIRVNLHSVTSKLDNCFCSHRILSLLLPKKLHCHS